MRNTTMRSLKTFTKQSVAVVAASIMLVAPMTAQAGGNATFTFSTSTVSGLRQGSRFTVDLVASVGSNPATIAHARVKFDPTKLRFYNANYANSPFTTATPDEATGSDFIQVSRYRAGAPYPKDNIFVVKLTFEAVASSGSTSVTIDKAQSGIYSEADYTNMLAETGAINVTFAPATTPGTGGTVGTGGTGGTGGGNLPSTGGDQIFESDGLTTATTLASSEDTERLVRLAQQSSFARKTSNAGLRNIALAFIIVPVCLVAGIAAMKVMARRRGNQFAYANNSDAASMYAQYPEQQDYDQVSPGTVYTPRDDDQK